MKIMMKHSPLSGLVKFLLSLTVIFSAAFCFAGPLDLFNDGKIKGVDAAADRYEYIGDNLVATGHVVLCFLDMRLTADKAVINAQTEDMELTGNVTFSKQMIETKNVTMREYEELLKNPFAKVRLQRYVTDPTGAKMLEVKITTNQAQMKADRVAGNLKSGVLQFRDFAMQSGVMFCTGREAERTFDGRIVVRDAKFTTCEYLPDNHDHYAIMSKKAVITPRTSDRGLFNYNPDQGEHSIWAMNSFLEIYGIPVFWFPVLHKPKDLSSFGGKIEIGDSSEWGFYVRTSKNFQLLDEPYLNTNLMLDFYQKRGFGYGLGADFLTPESSTEAMFYGISDRHPYYYWENSHGSGARWAENNSRLEIPHYRYEFRVSNLTHILPRLDFRGQIDLLSDYNFLDDYFSNRYDSVLEPPTFGSLEYQADRFTASLYSTVRINSFFTTVERLPEIRLDFQRQELLKNIYYQGETSFNALNMRWREFDRPRLSPILGDLQDYNTMRFDTLHMFYYPISLLNINIIPRTGFRLTAYSRSSDREVSYNDLSNMFAVDMVDGQPTQFVYPYDGNGGAQARFAGELGVEANTKFYHAWQSVKNAYWELDGLRHVAVPYVNYTFIPHTNVNKDHLYYFDEIDRISEQNFVRLGMVNRLQTRRQDQVYEWLSLENYWDYYFHKEDGFNSIGDLGTLLRFNPFQNLKLTSELLLDMGQNNSHDYEVMRNGKSAGRPGLNWKYLNRWETTATYQIAPDWKVTGSYLYSDEYNQRSPYSMGTMFSSVSATSMFINRFTRGQQLAFGFEFPLMFDKHLSGAVSCRYDIDAALMNDICFTLKRRFHCWDLQVAAGRTQERTGDDNTKADSYYISFFLSLSAMPGVGFGSKYE